MLPQVDEPAIATTPKPIAWTDGRVVPAADATVPLLDDGFLRGDAVFEVVLIRRGRTHALDAHLARMRRSAKAMGIRLPVLRQVIADLLAAWGERDGALRIIVTRGGTIRGLLFASVWPESISLQPVDMPWKSAITGVKTVSYAANMWASRQARLAHADDALVVSEGVVLEVPTAAIAWVRGDRIQAPDWKILPILDSITLGELTKVVEVDLGVYSLEDVQRADEAFILSATRGILPVHAIGDAELAAPGAVTERARAAFNDYIDSSLDPRP